MALPEQRLYCRIAWDGQRVTGVHLRATRLLEVTRLFAGRRRGEILTLLPRLYTLCGQAHAAAARLALHPTADIPAADSQRVRAENLREHLLYLFVHWPEAEARPPAGHELAPALALCQRLIAAPDDSDAARRLDAWLRAHLFAMPAEDFAALDEAALRAWALRGATLPARQLREALSQPLPAAPALPALASEDLPTVAHALSQGDAARFVARPALHDGCRHTGSAAIEPDRDEGLPAPARQLAARLRALARLASDAAQDLLFRNAGLACAVTSRGLLIHHARCDAGRVRAYHILAPTEWNFHPRGIAARWLARLETRDRERLRALATRMVRAIDPCVDFEIRIDTPGCLPEAAHA